MARWLAHLLVALCALGVACQKGSEAAAPKPATAPAPPAASAAPTPSGPPTFVASTHGRSDPECVGGLDFSVPESITFGTHSATLNGYRLTLDVPDHAPVTLGVLANLNEPSPANLQAIDSYLEFFKKKGAQAILVDGDSGDNAEAIEGVLRPIAKSGLPVLVLIGNREPKGGFLDAIEAVRKEFPNVFNLSRARQVDLGSVALLSLPGYHDPRYLIAGADGCLYHTDDLQALGKLASQVKRTIVLASHGPPHGDGAHAIDRVQNPPGNVGDPNLTSFLAQNQIAFGVFANIIEAGGVATNLHGDRVVPPGTPSSELYLNPGAADTVPWTMNDGKTAHGMAATLTIQDGKASYALFELPGKTETVAAKH
ncbi:MAG: hypothetical protein ACYCWW_00030 [Deltaproteobacteria bacterium]